MVSLQNPVTSTRHVAAAAKSLQSCPTLCDPIDSSPPGSLVPGILQKRILQWVAISFSTYDFFIKEEIKQLSNMKARRRGEGVARISEPICKPSM